MTTTTDEDARLVIYRSFADTGRGPGLAELASTLGVGEDEAHRALRRLAAALYVVVDAQDRIAMAHPFSSIPLGFSVMGTDTLWWGGCAWDSFAIPHLVDTAPDVLVATRCPACNKAHAWNVTRRHPPDGDQVVHFVVPTAAMWDDVVHTCGNQRIFCGEACIDTSLTSTGNQRGDVFDLATLWRLARGWYAGRLTRGYQRREPSDAATYLRDVGLAGEFWGL